jgi:DNA repair protein RadC
MAKRKRNIKVFELALELVAENVAYYNSSVAGPKDCFDLLEQVFGLSKKAEEHFVMLALSGDHRIAGAFTVSQGTLNRALVHPREVFKRALLSNAKAIIIAHNHPSGCPIASAEDRQVTTQLLDAGKLLGIPVLDHIIVGRGGSYCSFTDMGWI